MTRRMPLLPLLLLVLGFAACGSEDTKLKVTGIDPEKGDTDGGTYVRIKGNRFIADGARNAKVYFGSRQGTVIRFASDSELIVEAPGGKPNEKVDVLIIFEPGGELKIPNGFTFVEKNDTGPSVQDLDTSKVKK
ncbi:MAG: IPT/TIG domain-containing protein [Kofleriaceae bacterium]|nr:IPT/TIG domain-containing protein [Kofleriaceae bacterium]